MSATGIGIINEKVKKEVAVIEAIRFECAKVMVGQGDLLDRLLVGIFANGHVLVEGGPPSDPHYYLENPFRFFCPHPLFAQRRPCSAPDRLGRIGPRRGP